MMDRFTMQQHPDLAAELMTGRGVDAVRARIRYALAVQVARAPRFERWRHQLRLVRFDIQVRISNALTAAAQRLAVPERPVYVGAFA